MFPDKNRILRFYCPKFSHFILLNHWMQKDQHTHCGVVFKVDFKLFPGLGKFCGRGSAL